MLIAAWPPDAPRGAVTAFCRRHGVSRSRFYEIRQQARREGSLAAVVAPAVRRRPDLATPVLVEALALRIRKELAEDGWDHGPLSVRARLLELLDLRDQPGHEDLFVPASVPSRATLARIFTRHGAVVPAPKKRPHVSYRRFTFPRVHDCWQLDATEWHLADGRSVTIFQLEDDHSRYIVASHVAWSENSAAAVAVMRAAVTAHQAPVLLLTDNGMAMNPHRRGKTSQLAAYAASLGTRTITSRIYHPQTTGKNERLHQTLKLWLRARAAPGDLDQLTAWMSQFDAYYNHRRTHQALNQRTPATVLATAARALPPDLPCDLTAPARSITESTTTSTTTSSTPRHGRPLADQLSRVRVNTNGSVHVRGGYYIGLGAEYCGAHVLALVDATTATIYDMHGTELRAVDLVPGQLYYGTGRPRGGHRRRRVVEHSNPSQLSGPN
jgi:transposase InsO family protein